MSGKKNGLRREYILLALVVLLAFAGRAYGLNFPAYHWDEKIGFDNIFYASHNQLALMIYDHGSFLQYLILGSWYIYLMFTGAPLTTQGLLTSFFGDAAPFVLLARGLLVLAGTGTVVVVYALGRRAYSKKVGLLAAFLLALTFLHVAHSHYARGHILAAFFVTLAVYFCMDILQTGRRRSYVLAGLSIGLATGAQYSALLAVLPLLVAHVLRERARRPDAGWLAWSLDRSLLIAINVAALAFFAVTPYVLLDFPYFSGQVKGFLTQVVTKAHVSPEGQPVLMFYLTEHLRNGMGLGLEIVSLVGVVYALARRTSQDWVWLAFPTVLFFALGKGENFARYALPLLPFLALAAARLLVDAAEWARGRWRFRWADAGLVVVAIALLIPSTLNILRFDYWITQPDTRQLAEAWMRRNIPAGARLVVEGADVLGPDLPLDKTWLDESIAAASPDSLGRIYLEAIRASQLTGPGYRVERVFRLDEQHRGGVVIGTVDSADEYARRGVEYLVTVDWMQRDAEDAYSAAFQQSLDAAYQQIAVFEPTIHFRFDPLAWRMDYDALAQVVPGQPGIGGPRLVVYQLKIQP
ncbi:MAG: phospholipid carrier-dependent glycosyltransferase [Chloroflexi bacterium]|nr:phospholipid carrier-dependent glycosyltransferase [Chloroflexota bacterium]